MYTLTEIHKHTVYLKTGVGRVELLMLGVDAGAGGVQESLHTCLSTCVQYMSICVYIYKYISISLSLHMYK